MEILLNLRILHRRSGFLEVLRQIPVVSAASREVCKIPNKLRREDHVLIQRRQIQKRGQNSQHQSRVAQVVLIPLLLILLQIQLPPHLPVAFHKHQQRRVDVQLFRQQKDAHLLRALFFVDYLRIN